MRTKTLFGVTAESPRPVLTEDNDFTVLVPLSYAEAINVADFLDAYGEDADHNIAENIRYVAKQAKQSAQREV